MKQEKISPVVGGRTGAPVGASVDAVGVELAVGSLRLVRTRRGVVEDYTRISLPPTMALSSPEYCELLSSSMQAFCKHHTRADIWATAPFPKMHVRHLQIPKVSRRQLSLAVKWALRREIPGDLKGMFVDYTVGSEVVERGTRKINVTACVVRLIDIERIHALFVAAGFPLKGLTTPFFTYCNVVAAGGHMPSQGDRLFLDIGLASTQILLLREGKVAIHREFRLGVESFLDTCKPAVPAGEAVETFVATLAEAPSDGARAAEREGLMAAFQPVLRRLLRQLDMTLEAQEFALDELDLEALHLSGPLSVCDPVRQFMAEHLGHAVVALAPLGSAALAPGKPTVVSPASQAWFVPAVGLALSPSSGTLNLLRPIQSRWERAEDSTINQVIMGGFVIACLAICGGWGMAACRSARLQVEAAPLRREIEARTELLTVAALKPMLEEAVGREEARATFASERYLLAIMAELSDLTTAPIGWVACKVDLGPAASKLGAAAKTTRGERSGPRVKLVGRVGGRPERAAAELAAYQVTLDESPLFDVIEMKSTAPRSTRAGAMLEFTLTLRPVDLTARGRDEA